MNSQSPGLCAIHLFLHSDPSVQHISRMHVQAICMFVLPLTPTPRQQFSAVDRDLDTSH